MLDGCFYLIIPVSYTHLDVYKRQRYTCEKAYANKVGGIVGNEDVGQMSAWYVLAASGIHPSLSLIHI